MPDMIKFTPLNDFFEHIEARRCILNDSLNFYLGFVTPSHRCISFLYGATSRTTDLSIVIASILSLFYLIVVSDRRLANLQVTIEFDAQSSRYVLSLITRFQRLDNQLHLVREVTSIFELVHCTLCNFSLEVSEVRDLFNFVHSRLICCVSANREELCKESNPRDGLILLIDPQLSLPFRLDYTSGYLRRAVLINGTEEFNVR